MDPEIQNLHDLLASNSKHLIKIKLESNGELVNNPNPSTTAKRPCFIFLRDINAVGMDLTQFLNALVQKNNSALHIEQKKEHGNTSTNFAPKKKIIRYLLPDTQSLPQTAPSPVTNTTTMEHQAPQQTSPPVQHNNFDPYGQNSAATAGMNAAQMYMVDLKTKANESQSNLEKYMNECSKSKELESKILQLTAENLDLKTFKNTAEEKMRYAQLEAKLSTKSFADSEFAKEAMTMFPEIIASMKGGGGNMQQAVGMNNAANLSEVKQSFISNISNPQLQDAIVALLDRAAGGLIQLPVFNEEFNNLLNKHNL